MILGTLGPSEGHPVLGHLRAFSTGVVAGDRVAGLSGGGRVCGRSPSRHGHLRTPPASEGPCPRLSAGPSVGGATWRLLASSLLCSRVFAMTCCALPVLPTCRAEVPWVGPRSVAKRCHSPSPPSWGLSFPPGLSVGPGFQVLCPWVCFSEVPPFTQNWNNRSPPSGQKWTSSPRGSALKPPQWLLTLLIQFPLGPQGAGHSQK